MDSVHLTVTDWFRVAAHHLYSGIQAGDASLAWDMWTSHHRTRDRMAYGSEVPLVTSWDLLKQISWPRLTARFRLNAPHERPKKKREFNILKNNATYLGVGGWLLCIMARGSGEMKGWWEKRIDIKAENRLWGILLYKEGWARNDYEIDKSTWKWGKGVG